MVKICAVTVQLHTLIIQSKILKFTLSKFGGMSVEVNLRQRQVLAVLEGLRYVLLLIKVINSNLFLIGILNSGRINHSIAW